MSQEPTITFKEADGLELAADLAKEFGFSIPQDFELRVLRHWDDEYTGRLRFEADYTDIPHTTRHRLKRALNLAVPSWQEKYEGSSKDLAGEIERRNWRVEFFLSGAFVCEITGTEEVEPDQHRIRQADLIESLTDEQLEYLRTLEVRQLREPKTKHTYECKPV
jgi:hypothetical protein